MENKPRRKAVAKRIDKHVTTIWIDRALWKQIKQYCLNYGGNFRQFMDAAAREKLGL